MNSDSSDREIRILAMSKWQGSCGLPSSASTQGGCREGRDCERWQSDSQRPAAAPASSSNSQQQPPKQQLQQQQHPQEQQQQVEAEQRVDGMDEEEDEEEPDVATRLLNAMNPDSSDSEDDVVALAMRMVHWQGQLLSSASAQGGSREGRDGERWQSASQRAAAAPGSSSNSHQKSPKQLLQQQQPQEQQQRVEAEQRVDEVGEEEDGAEEEEDAATRILDLHCEAHERFCELLNRHLEHLCEDPLDIALKNMKACMTAPNALPLDYLTPREIVILCDACCTARGEWRDRAARQFASGKYHVARRQWYAYRRTGVTETQQRQIYRRMLAQNLQHRRLHPQLCDNLRCGALPDCSPSSCPFVGRCVLEHIFAALDWILRMDEAFNYSFRGAMPSYPGRLPPGCAGPRFAGRLPPDVSALILQHLNR